MMKKLSTLLFTPISKMKVFHQMLLIIGIMVVFSGMQGLLSFFTISKINANSQKMNENTEGIMAIREIQKKLYTMQLKYQKDVTTSQNLSQAFYKLTIDTSIKKKLDWFKARFPNEMANFLQNLDEMGNLLNQPILIANYLKISSCLDSCHTALDRVATALQELALNTMTDNGQFFKFANFYIIVLWLAGTILATGIGFVIALLLAKPLELVSRTTRALANGDLNKTIAAKGSLEINEMAEGLNMAIFGLRELVGGIDEQSNVLHNACQELKDASAENGKSASEVARAMKDLSRASTEQADQTTDAVNRITILANLVREVSQEIKNISGDSKEISESAQLGQKVTRDVTHGMVKIYDMTKEVSVVIEELDKTITEIEVITSVIQGIAEQTTRLAINAEVEAVRAQEYGTGFAVVAAETGKLADQSKQAAQLINTLIAQIKHRSVQAVQSMSTGMRVAESGKNLAGEATVTFENIFSKWEHILPRIESVALSAKKMDENNEAMIFAITNIATFSEECMASTEKIAAATEQQSAATQQVSVLAKNLNMISGNLKLSVARFEIH
jgi:methyl-accepting chemotaxis protein